MGRNMIGKVPHDLATRLNKENPDLYSVHLPLLQKNLRHFCCQRKYDF